MQYRKNSPRAKLREWCDQRGQDLIEYALMAGFVAVAAGAIMPGVATSISTIFRKIGAAMTEAAGQQEMAGRCDAGFVVRDGKCVPVHAAKGGK